MQPTVLTIDIGNTYTNLAVFKEKLNSHFSTYTNTHVSIDEISSFLNKFLARNSTPIRKLDKATVSTVVPDLEYKWASALQKNSIFYTIVNENSPWSFNIDIHPASQLGSDRMAATEAAICSPLPAIVVDAGTATTFDVIVEKDARPSYIGGVIAPGMSTSYEALLQKASRLSAISLSTNENFPITGTNTETAIRSGVQHGFALMVDSMIEAISKENNFKDYTTIATGGNSIFLKNISKKIKKFEPYLVLEGLYAVSCK